MIYLDYAASAPPYEQVIQRMQQVMRTQFGNPGALHTAGGQARGILQEARRTVAELLGVREQEVFFTSGATEANNWAVKLGSLCGSRKQIVAAATEHKSVLEAVRRMERQGYSVRYVYPGKDGRVMPEAVEALMGRDTALLCVQAVNHETGVMQDVAGMAALAKKWGARYLCDGVQSFGHTAQPLKQADMICLSAHKLGGPKGVGCLVVRYPHTVQPLLDGGGQEMGLRSGTENVSGIAGFALAAKLSAEALAEEEARLRKLSGLLVERLRAAAPSMEVVAGNAPRHPGIVNCLFPGITGEEMVMRLDLMGICASPGAACAARDPQPSHVLLAMGYTRQQAMEAVRFSLGRLTTGEQVEAAAEAVARILARKGL